MSKINVKVKRKEKDNSFSLLSKFQKKIQESKILPTVRKKRYNERLESKAKNKKQKIKKIKKTAIFEEMKRLGKLIKK